jgi:hypothetical protein
MRWMVSSSLALVDVQPEIAGNGVDFGGIERDTAAVDGVDQLAGAGVVVQHDRLAGKTGLEASK